MLAVLAGHALAIWQLGTSQVRLRRGNPDGSSIIFAKLLTVPRPSRADDTASALFAVPSSEPAAQQQSRDAVRAAAPQPDAPDQHRVAVPLGQASGDAGDGAFVDYFPRSRLTAPPTPLTPVQVPFPEQVAGIVDLRVVVSLFIDELGRVRRVRLDNPAIPPAFAQTIVDTFAAIGFKPGEIDTVPVRSQMRLEIEFRTGAASR